ncbi:MAG: transcription elongation factor GreA [Patescibacteria group bacterium]
MPTKQDQIIITEEEKKKLEEEIKFLDTTKRLEIATQIKKAAELGDVSENQLYTDSKTQMEMLELQISELRNTLKNAKVVKVKSVKGIVNINDRVSVRFEDGEVDTFQIVGSTNANPLEKKYSSASPIGQAILGKKVGDKVSYTASEKDFSLTIIQIID